jgi:Family of unknown function (DUF6338)
MVPGTWLTVVLFLLLVSPGLLFDLLAVRRRTGAVESAFHETSRIVLSSLGFTALALAVLAVVAAIFPGLLPDPKGLLDPDGRYAADHWPVVIGALAAESVLAHAAALLTHGILVRRGGATIRPMSAWTALFRRDRPKGHRPYVRLRLTGGIVYTGTVVSFTSDLPLADRELVLGPPLYSKTGDRPLSPLPPDYTRVLIRGAMIETMAVEYRPSDDGEPDPVGPPPGAGVGDTALGDLA